VPRKVFVAGEILTAADVNTNLMDQAVMVFDDSAARGSAIPSPIEGMVTYLKDTDKFEFYDGAAFGAFGGKILQVQSTVLTSIFSASVAQGAETEITGLTVSITPSSATSKILVGYSVSSSTTLENGENQFVSIFRGATKIALGDAAGNRQRVNSGSTSSTGFANVAFTFLDSPATTSPITYSLKLSHGRAGTETVILNRVSPAFTGDTDATNKARGASSITVMEVAG
jgi:hypothetical protein